LREGPTAPAGAREVLLGVSGGIAAYRAAELARMLCREGARVRVVMTRAATEFVTPLTFEGLTGNRVATEMFAPREEAGVEHVELARAAEVLVVAPATADVMARLALGLAGDLLTATALACEAPLILAPAMNSRMWRHPAVRANVETLRSRGATVVGPGEGDLACGEEGPGRMAEPAEILAAVKDVLARGRGAGPAA
jgi:phosphopantothenoylcysteine decarboxylase/phosphopantothenate--cysteine ligase